MLSGDEFLNGLRQRDPQTALLFERIINFSNNLAQHLQVDGSGKIQPPPPINAINVSVGDGMAHVTHTHTVPINKNLHYFTEWSTDSGGTWHVAPHGPSRETTIALPAKAKTGGATYNYIFRGYSQYQGSDASAPTYYGPPTKPTVVNVTGTTSTDLLPAVGSGTAAPNGEQGGQGFGTAIRRPAVGPTRTNLNSL